MMAIPKKLDPPRKKGKPPPNELRREAEVQERGDRAAGVEPAKGQYYGGGYRKLPLGQLFDLAPAEAVRRLVELLDKHDGNTTVAAKATGIHAATLKRWCARARGIDPEFARKLAAMRARAGSRLS